MNSSLKVKVRFVAFILMMIGLLALLIAPVALAEEQSPAAVTTRRPIEEFVAAQGTFCFDDGAGGCILFEPPLQNFLGQSDPARDLAGAVDYAGIANQYIIDNGGTSLGTTFSGTVVEKPLADGRADVRVNLHTKNALTWVGDGVDFSGPLLFGYKVLDVMAGEDAAVCNSTFRVRFINTAPGAPMPDLLQLVIFPEPGQELVAIASQCNARGELRADFGVPEGTPGRAVIRQIGRVKDGVLTFPVEKVLLKTLN